MKDRKLKNEKCNTESSVPDTSGSGAAVKKRKSIKNAIYDLRVKLHRATHKKTGVKRIASASATTSFFIA